MWFGIFSSIVGRWGVVGRVKVHIRRDHGGCQAVLRCSIPQETPSSVRFPSIQQVNIGVGGGAWDATYESLAPLYSTIFTPAAVLAT